MSDEKRQDHPGGERSQGGTPSGDRLYPAIPPRRLPLPGLKNRAGAGGPTANAKVVIVGAGFAGLSAARALRSAPADITIIDRHNYHCFQPLLYQVATATLSPADIAWPIRTLFRDQKNVTVLLATVTGVDVNSKFVSRMGGRSPSIISSSRLGRRTTTSGIPIGRPLLQASRRLKMERRSGEPSSLASRRRNWPKRRRNANGS